MASKELVLLIRDIGFYFTGKADVAETSWREDDWLYPLDWSYQLDREQDHFEPKDNNGIPLRQYPGSSEKYYLVSRIAAFGLAHWNLWRLNNSEHNREKFLNVANWLKEVPDARYEHYMPVAGLDVPWITCIAQGEAASVLSRAFIETHDRSFLVQAQAALAPLMVPVENGGLKDIMPDGRPFLEEYPGTNYRHVLNGCLYASVGIHDVMRTSGENRLEYERLFESIIDSIGHHIGAWDVDGWSTYDYPCVRSRARNLNTMTYQLLQTILLKYLAEASGDSRLSGMGFKWQTSADSLPPRMKALYNKVKYRVLEALNANIID